MNERSEPSQERPSNLPKREQKIAERVRDSLHLSPSMSLHEVAEKFRHSAAWRRERMGLAGEELRGRLWRATRPLLQYLWARVRIGWTWLRREEPNDSSRLDGGSGQSQDQR